MTEYVYIDGKFFDRKDAKISVFDHGLLYGDGVFEGVRAYNGRVFRLDEHVDRMYDGAKAIMLTPPLTKAEMKKAIVDTLKKNKLTDAYIRPIITRGMGDLGLDPRKCPKASVIVIAVYWGAMYGDLYEKGLTGVSVSTRRNAAEALPTNIKSLNYLNNILAKIEANEKGGDEAIIFDTRGQRLRGLGRQHLRRQGRQDIHAPGAPEPQRRHQGLRVRALRQDEDTHLRPEHRLLRPVHRRRGLRHRHGGGDRAHDKDRRPHHRRRQAGADHEEAHEGVFETDPDDGHADQIKSVISFLFSMIRSSAAITASQDQAKLIQGPAHRRPPAVRYRGFAVTH